METMSSATCTAYRGISLGVSATKDLSASGYRSKCDVRNARAEYALSARRSSQQPDEALEHACQEASGVCSCLGRHPQLALAQHRETSIKRDVKQNTERIERSRMCNEIAISRIVTHLGQRLIHCIEP